MKKRTNNTYWFECGYTSYVPYSVKGFADVTKDCSDFFSFIESFTESVVFIYKLILLSRLEWSLTAEWLSLDDHEKHQHIF